MNILHIIHRYFPEQGGAETHLRELTNYLAAQGHTLTVVTSNAGAFESFWDPRARRLDQSLLYDAAAKCCHHLS